MTQIRSMGLNKNIENNQSFLTRNRSESSEKFISIKYPYNKFLISSERKHVTLSSQSYKLDASQSSIDSELCRYLSKNLSVHFVIECAKRRWKRGSEAGRDVADTVTTRDCPKKGKVWRGAVMLLIYKAKFLYCFAACNRL